ncbi:hypothetical protein Vqi01_23660 [Micromonospora qiuiae]|uniref:Na+/H+ antiporter MnhB subunit-related protein domain-containing protein n=1 Tax=Micromonospora qiuiae TaxID=502268 RepID=A0ABQ4JAM2_9ACTN|nr:MnhB domain-containing protein [Micromonospora qiuiae]GIJ27204.1 hypothetical protein Vqi01_23660 [Micromonospora qiuiae]
MSRRARLLVFALGAAGLAVMFAFAVAGMPPFGTSEHPYRDLAVPAALQHRTANVVSSVNFDQRALDTLGEEVILLSSVIGTAALLRPTRRESRRPATRGGRVSDSTTLLSYLLLPVTVLIGLDVVVHGHLTPGGGFQGGVVLATAVHLLYLAGRYESLQRLRPLSWYVWTEGLSAASFAVLGLVGLALGSGFLANIAPLGSFQSLLSAGTVPILNIVTGAAVAGGGVVLLAQFFAQAIGTTQLPTRRSTS